MGPSEQDISDHQSDSQAKRPGRRPIAPTRMLEAADALFAASAAPRGISMEAIAAAAGVGKGTLFRAFGSRDELLDRLWAGKLASLHAAVEAGAPPLGPSAAPAERCLAFLEAVLDFKLANRHLIRAREIAPGLLHAPHYRWMHGLLQQLLMQAAALPEANAAYSAHALLAALHIDLLEELLATGLSRDAIAAAQATQARALIVAAQQMQDA